MLIVSEEFFEVFTQENVQNVLYFEWSVSKIVILILFKVRKPPLPSLFTPSHNIKVVKGIEDVIVWIKPDGHFSASHRVLAPT